jgi:hypothetical protein
MIKGLKPFEHRPAPSQNPLLRTQWMPELAPRSLSFLATNQLNYIIATWGQLVGMFGNGFYCSVKVTVHHFS